MYKIQTCNPNDQDDDKRREKHCLYEDDDKTNGFSDLIQDTDRSQFYSHWRGCSAQDYDLISVFFAIWYTVNKTEYHQNVLLYLRTRI